jgi:hypothetical protein
MASKNTTHLAGEFLVAGELSRRGYPVSITMGNAKSVDIHADVNGGKATIRVDAKAGRTKSNWPILKNGVRRDLYYVFVYLQAENKIQNNIFPEYYVISGGEIISKDLIQVWGGGRQGILYSTLAAGGYKGNWTILPPP